MHTINTLFLDLGPLEFDEPPRILRLAFIDDAMCYFYYLDGTFACMGHSDFIFDDMKELIS